MCVWVGILYSYLVDNTNFVRKKKVILRAKSKNMQQIWYSYSCRNVRGNAIQRSCEAWNRFSAFFEAKGNCQDLPKRSHRLAVKVFLVLSLSLFLSIRPNTPLYLCLTWRNLIFPPPVIFFLFASCWVAFAHFRRFSSIFFFVGILSLLSYTAIINDWPVGLDAMCHHLTTAHS